MAKNLSRQFVDPTQKTESKQITKLEYAVAPPFRVRRGWDNFYIMAGTAGATLIGLLFVVVTLGTNLCPSHKTQGARAFLTPALLHFGVVLLLALAMLAPWPSAWPIGIILGVSGLTGLVYQINTVLMRRTLDFVLLQWLLVAVGLTEGRAAALRWDDDERA